MNGIDSGFEFGALYRVGQKIGHGASGIVYYGINKTNNNPVAVKILREEFIEDPELVQRFITERNLLTKLNNPRIVKVHDLIAEGGRLGIVMEYVQGISLREHLRGRGGSMPLQEAAYIVREISEALAYAHASGIVHRDIKPDNVIISSTPDGLSITCKVMDFGISKILERSELSTHMVGTPEYMAPEQIQNNRVSEASDVYALGITLYELLSGRTPFHDDSTNMFIVANRQISSRPPDIPGLPAELADILEKTLAKNPQNRPSAKQLSEDISRILPGLVNLPALEPLSSPSEYFNVTVMKGGSELLDQYAGSISSASSYAAEGNKLGQTPAGTPASAASQRVAAAAANAPEIGPSAQATVLKALPEYNSILAPDVVVDKKISSSKRRIIIVASICGLLLIIGIIVAVLWYNGIFSWQTSARKPSASDSIITATAEDEALPSGLIISRQITYSKSDDSYKYKLTFKTVKYPISGDVMDVLSLQEGKCLEPAWQNPGVSPHSIVMTSIPAKCAWTINLPRVSVEKPFIQEATFPKGVSLPKTQTELAGWLKNNADKTRKYLQDQSVKSTAYPLQRIISLKLELPQRVTQGSTIPYSIIGVWPDGENRVSPIYSSESLGAASKVLTDISGGQGSSALRLNDRCSGAVSVSSNGREMVALHPATCEVEVIIGNYDLASARLTVSNSGS